MVMTGLGITVLISCGKGDRSKAAGKAEMAERPVSVARAEVRAIPRVIHVTGSLAAQEQSTLSAKVTGRLQRLSVDIGSVVRQGDLVAQIEPRDYDLGLQQAAAALAQARAALGLPLEGDDDRIELERVTAVKQAKAVLEEAGKNRDRVKSLSVSGIASQSEVDTVESAHTVALARYEAAIEDGRGRMATVAQRRAEFELARKRLADASVRAPFDGAVQARPATVGEYVAAGTPIVQLVKTDPLRLRLEVPERECILVRTGQVVLLLVEGDTNTYRGEIARLSPALDDQTRTLRVEADVPRQGSLRPGLFARARIIVTEHEQALTVPARCHYHFRRAGEGRGGAGWQGGGEGHRDRTPRSGLGGGRVRPGSGRNSGVEPGQPAHGPAGDGEKRAGEESACAGGEPGEETFLQVTDAKAG